MARSLLISIFLLGAIRAQAEFGQILPKDYRSKTITASRPLVLGYEFKGGDRVAMQVLNYPGKSSDLFFVHMHMNEVTAREAGEEMVAKNGGTFMAFVHTAGEREMKVRLDGIQYTLDPNRLFTKKALTEKTRPRPTTAHLAELEKFVEWFKKNVLAGVAQRPRRTVVALHNNSDDDASGSLLSIVTEKALIGIDNIEVHANPSWDIDNFYIATMKPTYHVLVNEAQSNASLRRPIPRDIGYISNWMIDEKIDYVNVETQAGDKIFNLKMIEILQSRLR